MRLAQVVIPWGRNKHTKMNTTEQYNTETKKCMDIFFKKNTEYGTAWKIYRPSSMTDKIYIKAKRIRTLQEVKENKVGDSIDSEFRAIVNYCANALTLLSMREKQEDRRWDNERLLESYKNGMARIKSLMEKKNHDYGEAWRDMRISSMTDEILVKIDRIKTMEDASERDSENFESNYMDIANYAIFCLILISEGSDPMK